MIRHVNVHEAKTHLSQLLNRVKMGEEFVIDVAGDPIARMNPVVKRRTKRKPGSGKGKVWISDDFNEPLPTEILSSFYP